MLAWCANCGEIDYRDYYLPPHRVPHGWRCPSCGGSIAELEPGHISQVKRPRLWSA